MLRAMSAQLVGQYDPAMTAYMNETMALYRDMFRTTNAATLLVRGISHRSVEQVNAADVGAAIDALHAAVLALAGTLSS